MHPSAPSTPRSPRPRPVPQTSGTLIGIPGLARAPQGQAGQSLFLAQASHPCPRWRQWLTQLVLAGQARELDDQQLPAIEAAPDAVGLGYVGAAGRRLLQHAYHLGVGVVGETKEGWRKARGQRLLDDVQASWGRDAGARGQLGPARPPPHPTMTTRGPDLSRRPHPDPHCTVAAWGSGPTCPPRMAPRPVCVCW